MLNDLEVRINSVKEFLATLPKNNKKNRQKYIDYLNDLVLEFSDFKDSLYKEINARYEGLVINGDDIDFYLIDEKILKYRDIFNNLNKWNTPYEKIGLDRCIFRLTHFYQDDFDNLNEGIGECVECFKKVGLTLKGVDFNHSCYVREYMCLFLNGVRTDRELRELFDKLYWQCPNIIFYIALNFRYLYYKNEKKFINYYHIMGTNILKDTTYDKLRDEYRDLVYKRETKDDNIAIIIQKLLAKEYNLKDYSKQMENSYYSHLTSSKVDFSNVCKLYNSLIEYSGYLECKYIIDKFKKLYDEKDKYKNMYKNTLKEIFKLESIIIKLNKKYEFQRRYFGNSNKLNTILLNIGDTLELVRSKYDELDVAKFYDKISTMDDNISYYDILELVCSYYLNIRKIIKEEYDISDDDVNIKIRDIERLLDRSNLNILWNIKIRENIDIALVISDRYRLLNFNVSEDSISNNSEMLIDCITKLKRIEIINNSKISYEELAFLCRAREIIVEE